jgi:flagellar basal-body rod modification protein FlgD
MPDVASIASNQKTIEQIIAEQANKSKNTRNTGELGKNDFLQLLITQVQHQDPLDPQSDTDFIAQMAQFSALEQMQNLNNAIPTSLFPSMFMMNWAMNTSLT